MLLDYTTTEMTDSRHLEQPVNSCGPKVHEACEEFCTQWSEVGWIAHMRTSHLPLDSQNFLQFLPVLHIRWNNPSHTLFLILDGSRDSGDGFLNEIKRWCTEEDTSKAYFSLNRLLGLL